MVAQGIVAQVFWRRRGLDRGMPISPVTRRSEPAVSLLKKVLYRQRGPALAGFDPVLVEVQHGLDALHAGAADAGKQVAAQTPDVAAGAWGRILFWKSAKWRV
jgi:hypothetical protein